MVEGAHGREEPVGQLRGAGVDVNLRAVRTVLVVLVLVTLLVLAVAYLVAGIEKNEHLDDLRQHGMPVPVTVRTCLGLLGGSGSNAAGIACTGTYVVDGHRYSVDIPGNAPLAPGDVIRGVVASDDPSLFTTPGYLATQHASAGVFVLAAVFGAGFVLALVAVALWRRRRPAP